MSGGLVWVAAAPTGARGDIDAVDVTTIKTDAEMSQCDPQPQQPSSPTMTKSKESRADAVRYLVLRRLGAGMRHALMGELQAVQFASDLAAQMVKRGVSGPPLGAAISQISDQTRAATEVSRSIMEWLRPEPGSRIEVDAALHECVKAVGETWILRGIKSTMRGPGPQAKVGKAVFLETVVASLLALTDVCPGALDIDLAAERIGCNIAVRIGARAADRRSAAAPVPHRLLTFEDVRALAEAGGISCACEDAAITLEFQPLAA